MYHHVKMRGSPKELPETGTETLHPPYRSRLFRCLEEARKNSPVYLPVEKDVEKCVRVHKAWQDIFWNKITSGPPSQKKVKASVKRIRTVLDELDQMRNFVNLETKYPGSPYPVSAHRMADLDTVKRTLESLISSLQKYRSGGSSNYILGKCAAAAAGIYKMKTGNPQWRKVGLHLELGFGIKLKDPEEPRLWAYQLAKRYKNTSLKEAWAPILWGLIEKGPDLGKVLDICKASATMPINGKETTTAGSHHRQPSRRKA